MAEVGRWTPYTQRQGQLAAGVRRGCARSGRSGVSQVSPLPAPRAGVPRTTESLLARTSPAALASPAAARQSRVVLPFHARVWLRPET